MICFHIKAHCFICNRNGTQQEGKALYKVQFFYEIYLQTRSENLGKVEAGGIHSWKEEGRRRL